MTASPPRSVHPCVLCSSPLTVLAVPALQVAALLAVHAGYLLCLRGCQPWGSRLEQGALVVNEAGEVAMWALGAVLLAKQRQTAPGSM